MAETFWSLSDFAMNQGDLNRSEQFIRKSYMIFQKIDDKHDLADVLGALGHVLVHNRVSEGLEHFENSLALS